MPAMEARAGHARDGTGHARDGTPQARAHYRESAGKKSRPRGAPTEGAMNTKPGHSALRKGRVSLEGQIYLVTTTTLERQPFFADFKAGQAAAQAFEDKAVLADARLLAWVLMPDHFHGLLQLGEKTRLQDVINRMKSASARRANRALGREGSLWAKAYHDHALRREEDLLETARYMVANPVRAGWVRCPGDYPFWNAIWLPLL
jgi:putative transposase